MAINSPRQIAISPDGSTLVYVAQLGTTTQLYRRDLSRVDVTPIPGTEGAVDAFFSPDGEWIGFASGNDLVSKVPTAGGPAEAVGSGATSTGATWIDGSIVAVRRDGTELLLFADDGTNHTIVVQGGPFFSPSRLPNPRWVLGRLDDWRVGVIELETGNLLVPTEDGPKPYVEAEDIGLRGTSPRYLPSGQLMFTRFDGVVAAVPFDAASLTILGDPEPVLEGVRVGDYLGEAQWAAGANGVLVYAPGEFGLAGRLTLIDEEGATEELPFAPRVYGAIALAPSGQRVAAQVYPPAGPQEVRVFDLEDGTDQVLKSGWTYNSLAWCPDSESVIYLQTVPGATGDARGRLTRHRTPLVQLPSPDTDHGR